LSIILIILAVIGIAIAAIIGLVLILLVIALICKFEYRIKIIKKEESEIKYDIRVKWLFGIIKRRVSSDDAKQDDSPKRTESTGTPAITKKKRSFAKADTAKAPDSPNTGAAKSKPWERLKDMTFDKAMRIIGYTLSLIKRIFVTFAPKRIVVRGRYGAATPDITGKVLAAIYAAAGALNIRAEVEGDFEKEMLVLNVRAYGYFRLWVVFWPMVRYIIRPEIWRLIFPKKAKKARKVKKNNLEVDENGHRI